MIAPRLNTKLCAPAQIAQVGKAAAGYLHTTVVSYPAGLRLACVAAPRQKQRATGQARQFSTTGATHLRDFYPVKETADVHQTPPMWPHPGFTEKQILEVEVGHREPRTIGDKVAWRLIRISRWCMDKVTGLSKEQQTDKKNPTTALSASKPLTEAQWLTRFIFLESIAAVPGMVAGMLRHLRSLRQLKRDNGWIETMLEEAYNERMHLLTLLKMCEPGWLMRFLIMGAQGVYFNALFLSYLISPSTCHRFVGYLEEEAVHTYTRCIHELEQGLLPRWSDPKFNIPEIAVTYWRMPEGHRTMRDLLLWIKADESKHRGVHHTLAGLDQALDKNPFCGGDGKRPDPSSRPGGYERGEVIG